jgi:arabinogalactan endo-1,4-beta-galactosidase
MKRLLSVLLAGCMLLPCMALGEPAGPQAADIFVMPVEGLKEDFIFGTDISSLPSLEKSGVTYKDEAGNTAELTSLLSQSGFNYVRVRVWNDPFDGQGRGYGGGNCNVDNAVELGRRATANGMKLLVDFHYSDFWADPKKQQAPKTWVGMDIETKAKALHDFTYDALKRMKDANIDIGMVQIGNETDTMLCGENNWIKIAKLINAGSAAVREIDPAILVAVHFSQPALRFAQILNARKVDYDVYATSYYSYWHGTTGNLTKVLSEIAATYNKLVMVAETAYLYTVENGDEHANSCPADGITLRYATTVQGQANAMRELAAAVQAVGEKALGIFYWEPAWLPVPVKGKEAQGAMWEMFGSGWASSYAGSYDPNDAGLYYGGSSWDNQALFDFTGKALPTLKIFQYIRTGAAAARKVDSYEDPHTLCYIDDGVALPETVNALYNDGTTEAVSVVWNALQLEDAIEAGLGEYVIEGVADGTPVSCFLRITAQNFLKNPGFEEEDMSMWKLQSLEGIKLELERRSSVNDVKSGDYLLHFYSTDKAGFTVEQTVTGLREGEYDFSLYIHGGNVAKQDMYIYAIVDGRVVATAPMKVTKWQEWENPTLHNIPVKHGEITVGAYVACEGSGPWGKLDDFLLNLSRK